MASILENWELLGVAMKKLSLKITVLLALNFFAGTELNAVFFGSTANSTTTNIATNLPSTPKLIGCNTNKPDSCNNNSSKEQAYYCQPLKFKYPTVANKNKGACLPTSYQDYLNNTKPQDRPRELFYRCDTRYCAQTTQAAQTTPAPTPALTNSKNRAKTNSKKLECACGDNTKTGLHCEPYNPTSKLFTESMFGICVG